MTYLDIIILRISTLCKQRGITYNKLAQMCGLNQSTIVNIMHGVTKNPRLTTMERIANGLNMTVAELLDFPELNNYSFEDDN